MAAEIASIAGVAAPDPRAGSGLHAPELRPAAKPATARPAEPRAPLVESPENVGLVFEVSQDGRSVVIKLVDQESHRVIREIPPEEMQKIHATIRALLGLHLDRTG